MIEMLVANLDGTLADRLLHLAGPDSLRHRLFVADDDESERAHDDYVAGLSISVIERTRKSIASNSRRPNLRLLPAFSGSGMDDSRVLLVWSSSPWLPGITP
ncbi:unnamed protein product [Penicillium roqueforti FM164]|uniref:Str. FM013 n=2 Tax=Penicillium TaxID=5073 RepID=A0A0G4PYR9_PENC3|nr:unnamed protein product [Penicillium roqueforti FM164]CRL31318.1 unnamed protein product [Penicillium camemberti]